MGTVLTILLWLLAAVLSVAIMAMVAPLRVEFRATAGEVFRYHLALRPFGRLGPKIAVADSERPSRRKPERQKTPKPSKSRFRDPSRIMRAGLRLLSDIPGKLQIDRATVELRFGTGDPAETGELYGALTPFIFGLFHANRVRLAVEPVFDQSIFRGQMALDLSLMPARLIPPFARFGWALFGARR